MTKREGGLEHMSEDRCENLPVWQPGHDWRLYSREPVTEMSESSLIGVDIKQVGWRDTWYCARCRKITIDPRQNL